MFYRQRPCVCPCRLPTLSSRGCGTRKAVKLQPPATSELLTGCQGSGIQSQAQAFEWSLSPHPRQTARPGTLVPSPLWGRLHSLLPCVSPRPELGEGQSMAFKLQEPRWHFRMYGLLRRKLVSLAGSFSIMFFQPIVSAPSLSRSDEPFVHTYTHTHARIHTACEHTSQRSCRKSGTAWASSAWENG